MAKSKKQEELEQQLAELTADLQRTRADFENYRKRMEQDKIAAREAGQIASIVKLLPVIDDIERAVLHIPEDLKTNLWAQGVSGLAKGLEKSLTGLGLMRIEAAPGTAFNPSKHEAIQFDDADGEHEVIAEELRAGYTLGEMTIRPSMVKVTRQ